ncbi:MAG: arylamine N-acetyltransferase [Anaerolineaceae bacterium]|nr:arylamine N-acetyltransferase [Anaerolineaceae bacterium]
MDVQAYLNRVDYTGSLDVSAETLRGLHIAHTMHVPFENLDIHLGRPISLKPDALFDKLVRARRGGYCFEMNGLFALVLGALGFDVTLLLARMIAGSTEVRPLTHQVLLVTIGDERWIADVGGGRNGPIAPLPLVHHAPERQFHEHFRLEGTDGYRFTLQLETVGVWQDIYAFTLEPHLPVDYEPANFYTSNWPDSHFRKNRVCTLPTETGRMTFTGHDLRIQSGAETRLITAENDADYRALLRTYFGVAISGGFVLPQPESR